MLFFQDRIQHYDINIFLIVLYHGHDRSEGRKYFAKYIEPKQELDVEEE